MADSSKDIQLHELKDMINDLKKMIKTLQATVDAANKREESLTQERDNLKEEIDLLRKKLFGTSSEKRTIDIPGQLNFFNEAELEQNPEAVKAEDLEALLPEKTAKKCKKPLDIFKKTNTMIAKENRVRAGRCDPANSTRVHAYPKVA